MKKEMTRRAAAIALTICMIGTGIPWNATFAAEADADNTPKAEAQAENKHESNEKSEPKSEAPAEHKESSNNNSEGSNSGGSDAKAGESEAPKAENNEANSSDEANKSEEAKAGEAEAPKADEVKTDESEAPAENNESDNNKSNNNESGSDEANNTDEANNADEANNTDETNKSDENAESTQNTEEAAEGTETKTVEKAETPNELTKAISRQIMDQEDCDFTLEYSDTEYEISFEENVLTISGKSEGPATEVNIRMKDGKATTEQRIVLAGATVTVLESINILAKVGSAITLDQESKANATIIIDGDVSLQGQHGIAVIEGTEVTIKGASGKEGNDSLTVKGGGVKGNSNWGTGIGYYIKGGADAGIINLMDIANVTATGSTAGEGGAAIGGGRKNSADNGIINIENVGNLNAYGGGKAAAIGAGFWKAADVNIKNSHIENAIGGSTAAGIGSSRNTIEALSSADWLDEDKMSVLTTRINIEDSVIENAAGGKNGAGIGTGTSDQLWGDYSRNMGSVVGNTYKLPETVINITGNSEVTAKGGDQAAAIGGGYKVTTPEINIGSEATVTAYAGKSKGTSDKVASAIGGGADGSSIYTDKEGTINIEDGAKVYAFGYGYEAFPAGKDAKSSVIGNKWAMARDTQDDDTTAVIFNGRFLDQDHFSEEAFQEGYNDLSKDHEIELTNLRTGEVTSFTLPKGFTSFATALEAGEYKLTVDGNEQHWSYLEGKGYNAVTDGAVTGASQLVYGDEEVEDAAINYEQTYQTYGDKGDSVTVKYAFGDASANFIVGKGVNNFDAIAIRENVELKAPAEPEEPEVPAEPEEPAAPSIPAAPETPNTPAVDENEEPEDIPAEAEEVKDQIEEDIPEVPAKAEDTDDQARSGKVIVRLSDSDRAASRGADGRGAARVTPAGAALTAANNTAANAAAQALGETATPMTALDDANTPMGTAGSAWALINLIATILTALLSILMIGTYFINRKDEDEQEDETETKKKRMAMRIMGLVPAIAAIITFILTEDMTLPMQMIDKFTILMVLILAVEAAVAIIAKKKAKDEDENEEAAQA